MSLLALCFPEEGRADTNRGTVEGQTYIEDGVFNVPAGVSATVNADCLPGTSLIGGGAAQNLGSTFNLLTGIYPADGPDGDTEKDDRFVAQIYSLTDTGNSHYVRAICAGGSAPSYPSEAGTVTGDGSSLTTSAACPAGTYVSSGGVRIFSAAGGEVNSSYPFDGPDVDTSPDDGWRARVVNIDGGSVSFRVFAICRTSLPIYRTLSQTMSAGTSFGAVMPCEYPYPYGPVMGGGARFTGSPEGQHLTQTTPFDSPPGAAPSNSWNVVMKNGPTALTITRFSICKP